MGNITIYHPNILWKVTIYSEFPMKGIYMENYGTSPFLMDKSTISMAIFNSFLCVYRRVTEVTSDLAATSPSKAT